MSEEPLKLLREKYPSAIYNYFRVTNFEQALEEFLNNPEQNPRFKYPRILKSSYIQLRKDNLSSDIRHSSSQPTKKFLRRRQQETELLEIFWKLRRAKVDTPEHQMLIMQYKQAMHKLYKPPKREIFDGAMCQVYSLAHRRQKLKALSVLESNLNWNNVKLYQPSQKNYEYYKNLLRRIAPELFAVSTRFNTKSVGPCIESFMYQYGLTQKGWMLVHKKTGSNVMVSGQQKKIYLSDKFKPKNKLRLRQIVGHEVFGHARRVEFGSKRAKNYEEEGIAILIEQLLARTFSNKRLIRYLVVCLAYGVDGIPRDFKDTYRLALPIVRIVTGSPSDEAKIVAFRECLRVFRGGSPDIPGAVFIKDKVYLESSIAVWQYLERDRLGQEEFSDILASHATIWSDQDKL